MRGEDSSGPSPRQRKRPSHLAIAQILTPHGLKGEVKAKILTDFPDRFSLLKTVYLGEELSPVTLEGHRPGGSKIILKLDGCEDRDQAGLLRGKLIFVPVEEAMPLDEDEYYVHEVVGLQVWTTEGELLGLVDEVLFTGSNDVYVVKDGDKEVLIPAVSNVVKEVDTKAGRMEVRLVEGLR